MGVASSIVRANGQSYGFKCSTSQMIKMKNLVSEVAFHFATLLFKTSTHYILTAYLRQDLRIVGKYQPQRKLGGGGFGAVYIGDPHAK